MCSRVCVCARALAGISPLNSSSSFSNQKHFKVALIQLPSQSVLSSRSSDSQSNMR